MRRTLRRFITRSFASVSPLAFLLLLCGRSAAAQEPVLTIEVFEPEVVMTSLFGSDRYTNERGVAWRPDIEEQATFVVSDDGYCYTEIDTLIFFTTGVGTGSQDHALLVFSTHSYFGEERSACHGCAPQMGAALFNRSPGGEEGGWGLVNVRKFIGFFGGWGEPGTVSFVSAGPSQPILSIASSYTGQGHTFTSTQWFDVFSWIHPFNRVFSYDEIIGPGGCEEECDAEWCERYVDRSRQISLEANVDPDSQHPGYDDIVMTTIDRDCAGNESRMVSRFSYDPHGYRRVCE